MEAEAEGSEKEEIAREGRMDEITLEFTGQGKDINDFSFALFDVDRLGAGAQKEIPGGGTLTMGPMMMQKAAGIPKVIEVLLTIGGSIGVNLASNHIYDKLK